MAHIIALQGPSNAGKTSTLIQVLKDLQAKYPSATVQVLHGGSADVQVILHNVNGKTVGIESQGDPGSRLEKSLAYFITAKCDIIFCACRTKGMTVSWINALSSTNKVTFVQKARASSGHASANSVIAASLVQMAGL